LSLEEVFYLSQSIASVAVVGSLIYLGLQVRAADRGQRSIMQQGRADRVSKAWLTMASPELADVWQKGIDADAAMTRTEVTQWLLICRSAFLSWEDSFLQHQVGALDQASFDSFSAGVRSNMSKVGFRAAWKLLSGPFGREFREFVDAQFAATPVSQTVDIYEEWQKTVQAMKPNPNG
jgi:hypothetical protein